MVNRKAIKKTLRSPSNNEPQGTYDVSCVLNAKVQRFCSIRRWANWFVECLEDGLDNTLGIVQNFSNTGMPSSLAHFDKGLSTIIPYSTIYGNGSALNSEQRGNMQRMIRWNKISTSNRSHHRKTLSLYF